jgi:hypothetical protein
MRVDVKRMLKDYQGALEDLDKAHVLEPNYAFTLKKPWGCQKDVE